VEAAKEVKGREAYCMIFRPFMIQDPYQIHYKSTLKKVLDLFRLMNLRQLTVVDDINVVIGIITRKDLFAYLDC
jgi:predicted transcriptional regulator